MYSNFWLLGLELLPEVIVAILRRSVTLTTPTDKQTSVKSLGKLPNWCSRTEKLTLDAGNGGPTRWDGLFLSPFNRNGCSHSLAKPKHSHALFSLWENPRTSPCPNLSAHIDQGHFWKWHQEAEVSRRHMKSLGNYKVW